MRAEVRYLTGPTRNYAFEVPEGTIVGKQFLDGDQIVQVVALGSSYDGPVRALARTPRDPFRMALARLRAASVELASILEDELDEAARDLRDLLGRYDAELASRKEAP